MKIGFNILLLCFVFFTSGSLKSQAQPEAKNYSFIRTELNRLSFSSDSASFQTLFRKMETLKESKDGKISIVHIGGSHVQGGIWSNTFMGDFQENQATTGGGYFTFPYKIAKTNSQPYTTSFTNGKWKRCRNIGKETCVPIGMNGLSIITNDSANFFGIALTPGAFCKSVNIVKVYHNFNNSFMFTLNSKFQFNYTRDDNADLGYTAFTFISPIDSVWFDLVRKDTLSPDFIVYGFSLENNLSPGFYLAGLGANGAASGSFLRCSNFVQQLSTIHPDLVVLSLGVNDTQSRGFDTEDYIEHYDSLIANIKKASPAACIILTTTTDNFIKRKNSNKRTITARDAMFELMAKHHVAVWDLFSIMGGYKSMIKWNKAGLAARDKVHFTARGYVILGHLMFEAVNRARANYKLAKN